MAIDSLQNKIRKSKVPMAVEMTIYPEDIPADLRANCGSFAEAYDIYCRTLMDALKGHVPALRFSCSFFTMMGQSGMSLLNTLTKEASAQGFYVMLDAPEAGSPGMAAYEAEAILGNNALCTCDGVIVSAFSGSDIWKPFLPYCKEKKKDLFVTVRSGNKSASELQDLLSGSRQVHTVAADYVNRFASELVGRSGFSNVAIAAASGAGDSIKGLRTKYPKLFMLVDGLEYPSASVKNCANAFDRLGHGAIVCLSSSVTCAWKKEESLKEDYAGCALSALERIRKNFARYVTVL